MNPKTKLESSKSSMKKKSKKVTIEEEPKETITTTNAKTNGTSTKLNQADPDSDKNVQDKLSHKRIISDFFRASRIKPNSIKLPECNISRGLVLAIVFFVLFGLIMVWFVFSSDTFDLDDELDQVKTKHTKYSKSRHQKFQSENKTNRSKLVHGHFLNQLDPNIGDKGILSTKLFVLFSTIFIVLCIISFVFIGALIHYFTKPKSSYGPSSRGSIVSSIFSHHNHHNHLYYLDREIQKEEERERSLRIEAEKNEQTTKSNLKESKKSKSKSKSKPKVSIKSKDIESKACTSSSPTLPKLAPPIIIVHEDSS